ncbi:hypothetical protein [Lactiplantibacillus fabifermentans]|uniref:Uncharacterized protein n=1 Tax=Lactiplantibacillus fabifermentans T30PCM01 TaxID=1400520 RepID=W6T7L9_9LACO|nr:hypothetical protein [Lactiplantibacillus fabifermentans]ETY73878.1 hypothetical protein LFAB_10260 [Lactiplantibacillus fabifermentans T30PCM01]
MNVKSVTMSDKYCNDELEVYLNKLILKINDGDNNALRELRLIYASILAIESVKMNDFNKLKSGLRTALWIDISFTEPTTGQKIEQKLQLVKKIQRYPHDPIYELRLNFKSHAFRAIFFWVITSFMRFNVYVSCFTKTRHVDTTDYYADICYASYCKFKQNPTDYLAKFMFGGITNGFT